MKNQTDKIMEKREGQNRDLKEEETTMLALIVTSITEIKSMTKMTMRKMRFLYLEEFKINKSNNNNSNSKINKNNINNNNSNNKINSSKSSTTRKINQMELSLVSRSLNKVKARESARTRLVFLGKEQLIRKILILKS